MKNRKQSTLLRLSKLPSRVLQQEGTSYVIPPFSFLHYSTKPQLCQVCYDTFQPGSTWHNLIHGGGMLLESLYLTVQQVAQIGRIHPETVRKHILSGRLKARKLGKGWKIYIKDAAEYLGISAKELKEILNEQSQAATGAGLLDPSTPAGDERLAGSSPNYPDWPPTPTGARASSSGGKVPEEEGSYTMMKCKICEGGECPQCKIVRYCVCGSWKCGRCGFKSREKQRKEH